MTSLKQFIKRNLPGVASVWTDLHSSRYFERRYGAMNRDVRQTLYGNAPVVVLSGPFKGMRYTAEIGWGSMTPKWIGCYEDELSDVMKKVIQRAPSLIVDLGAAEGYFAVGLARALPGTVVHAFDGSRRARRGQRALSRLNGCANVRIHGLCSHRDLDTLLAGQATPFVLCDIEGAEMQLLDPAEAGHLARADVLVECHRSGDFSPFQNADQVTRRFEQTHLVEQIVSRDRDPVAVASLHPSLSGRGSAWLRAAADEGRGEPQCWLWMRSRAAAA